MASSSRDSQNDSSAVAAFVIRMTVPVFASTSTEAIVPRAVPLGNFTFSLDIPLPADATTVPSNSFHIYFFSW